MSMRKNILLALGCMIGLSAGASHGVVKTVTLQQGVTGAGTRDHKIRHDYFQ